MAHIEHNFGVYSRAISGNSKNINNHVYLDKFLANKTKKYFDGGICTTYSARCHQQIGVNGPAIWGDKVKCKYKLIKMSCRISTFCTFG
jgi:hypothetical protein